MKSATDISRAASHRKKYHIQNSRESKRKLCYVFEGFMDYLSFLTLKLESCPQSPDFDRQDYMVLNSVAKCFQGTLSAGQL